MNIEVFVRAIYGEMVGFNGIKYYSLAGFTSLYMGLLGGTLAVIIAYLLDSVVTFFMRKLKVRRCQGILLACIILIGLIGFLVYNLWNQLINK
jgi:predicted PurR-regulated permease PerM